MGADWRQGREAGKQELAEAMRASPASCLPSSSWARIAFRETAQAEPIKEDAMRFGSFKFGSIEVDGVTYEYDVVIDRGSIRKRKKKPSKPFRRSYGHTPLSAAEDIPLEVPAAGGRHGFALGPHELLSPSRVAQGPPAEGADFTSIASRVGLESSVIRRQAGDQSPAPQLNTRSKSPSCASSRATAAGSGGAAAPARPGQQRR
jgi:hypothetical protein